MPTLALTRYSMQNLSVNQYLRAHIRTVPDWPAPGVQFRDITPLLQDAKVFRVLIDAFIHRYMDPSMRPDVVAGLDARGFILGAVVSGGLNPHKAGGRKWRRKLVTESSGHLWCRILVADSGAHGATNG